MNNHCRTNAIFEVNYPFILGADVSGIVEEVGEGVTHVTKGQRVMGFVFPIPDI